MMIATPVFATVINNNSATCDGNTLGVTSGSVRLRAKYAPKTINLKWLDSDGNTTTTNTCTYDGGLTLPTQPTKSGYTFKGWKVITDYTPIEYIESTGTQYIDTGVPGDNNNLDIIVDFMVLDLPQDKIWYNLLENYAWSENSNIWRILFGKDNRILFYTNTKTNSPRYIRSIDLNQRYLVDMDYNRVIINGTQYNYSDLPIGTTNNTIIKLFGSYVNSITGRFIGRVYSFKIYDNGTLIRDMIPVKDLSGVACMYDKVSGQFFYNQGTGNFIAGPDL